MPTIGIFEIAILLFMLVAAIGVLIIIGLGIRALVKLNRRIDAPKGHNQTSAP
ncbi:hypothetical protein [Corynebacterium sp. A21]|uniref:hypothetical protein n=1 Tax=Corynebacterium sp. A21 TaxID=3457318 RepID=UPI003FD48329